MEGTFLKNFAAIEILSKDTGSNYKPVLLYAEYKGEPKLIKFWAKSTSSAELEQLWLQEIRQLQRLKGYPNPESHIAYLDRSGTDETGFYLVLDTTGRLPLAFSSQSWLKAIKSSNNHKLKFWKNIIRVVRAIEFLHSQGILHRNLDLNSILIGDEYNNDNFQLTGFEWSIRIQTVSVRSQRKAMECSDVKAGTVPQAYSFCNDWYSLGVLIVELLGIRHSDLEDLSIPPIDISTRTQLTVREITLIRALLGIVNIKAHSAFETLGGEIIEESIENNIIRFLDEYEKDTFDLMFSFRKFPEDGTASDRNRIGLLSAVRKVYEEVYHVTLYEDDVDQALEFVKQDLTEDLVILSFEYKNEKALLLKGKKLIYLLEPYKPYRTATKTWDTAFCTAAFCQMPNSLKSNDYYPIDPQLIRVFSTNQNSQNFSYRSWSTLLDKVHTKGAQPSEKQRNLVDGFIAFHQTELAYARTDIYPVKVYDICPDPDERDYQLISFTVADSLSLEKLSSSLDLKAPAKRLKQTLTDEEAGTDDWILTRKDNFQDDDECKDMAFIECKTEKSVEIYTFRTKGVVQETNGVFYISPSSIEGTIKQLKRRAKSIELFNNHTSLLDSLLDPHSMVQNSPEAYLYGNIEQHLENLEFELDESKTEAFKNILHTLPSYLVQGPPGVGKTYLVSALIKHIFSHEREARVLLTAQSHSTVHHLYQEVIKTFSEKQEEDHEPLIVKCIRSPENENKSNAASDLDIQARELLSGLTKAPIFLNSDREDLKSKIINSCIPSKKSQRHGLIDHLLNSANLVFTTTNSRYMANMLATKTQFDWSVMEEAGKVSGIELLSPLLLSHRRLLIGDHLQLPPYRTAQFQTILNDPKKLRDAFQASVEGKKKTGKLNAIDSRIQEIRKLPLDNRVWGMLSLSASRTHLMFKMLIDKEDERRRAAQNIGSYSHRPTASLLTEQYRMHPTIADVVSDTFYDTGLKTNSHVEKKYEKEEPPFFWLPDSQLVDSPPIVWVNTPDVMQKKHSNEYMEKPTWFNPSENKTIFSLLKNIRARHSRIPKLAILSAYNKQKKILEKKINVNQENALSHLAQFSKPDEYESFCSTISSFQGVEADLIILSMVRNNVAPTVRSAFGFFIDKHLFNVMLSRARYQIVIVGSFDFIKRWSNKTDVRNNPEYRFLKDLVDKILVLEKEKKLLFVEANPNK